VLTRAFEEITGIKVNHQLLGEGEVVQAVQTQMQTNRNLYDAYINDSDLIGTHSRLQSAVNLTDWMAGEAPTSPTRCSISTTSWASAFTTGPDGKLWQLPDQQFANLYWFRKDWFDREDLKEQFKAKYGYDLGVPVNWSAYEDIAEFFTNDVKEIDGVRIYGHMDYGKRAPDLGWRMTDAWLSMAGSTSPACPTAARSTSGASAWRKAPATRRRLGLARRRHQCPASVYAIRQVGRVAAQLRPAGRRRPRLLPVAAGAGQGNVAQQIFWYTAVRRRHGQAQSEGNNTVDDDGNPLWRMAPSPHGPYWKEGMKLGYQDVGSWTLFKSTPSTAQGGLALRPVRRLQDGRHQEEPRRPDLHPRQLHAARVLHRARAQARRLVEFYRSPDRVRGRRPASTCPTIRSWPSSGGSRSVTSTPAPSRRRRPWTGSPARWTTMARMQAADEAGQHLRRLRPAAQSGSRSVRVARPSRAARAAKLENEKEQGQTIAYDELVKRWTENQYILPGSAAPGHCMRSGAVRQDRSQGSEPPEMSLELEREQAVGATFHIHPTRLDAEPGGFNTLLGPTLAGKTTLMQLMAGLERPTSGEVWFRGKNVDRRAGAEAQRRHGLPAVHQLPELHVFENIASPLRVAGVARPRSKRVGASRRAPAADADARPHAVGTVGRPAAAHRDRARAGQGLRPGPARRAARQSRLQAARGAARRAAEAVRRRDASSSMPRPSRPRRCSRRHTATLFEGRVTQFGADLRYLPRPDDLVTARVFSDPPINTAPVTKSGDEILIGGDDPCRPARPPPRSPTGTTRSASGRITSLAAGAATAPPVEGRRSGRRI
jgi:glycerol transport system substrate-binding protein